MKDKKGLTPRTIPDHVDGMRLMLAESKGTAYVSYKTLRDAVNHEATLIMQGDDGGQIYLTYPSSKVRCSEQQLNELLKFVDSKCWKDIDSASLLYEAVQPGQGVPGGMGGGMVTGDLWLHPKIAKLELESKIREILEAKATL